MRQKAAQSGVHSIVALAAMAVVVGAAGTSNLGSAHAAGQAEQSSPKNCHPTRVLKARPPTGEEAREKVDADDYTTVCIPIKRTMTKCYTFTIHTRGGTQTHTRCYAATPPVRIGSGGSAPTSRVALSAVSSIKTTTTKATSFTGANVGGALSVDNAVNFCAGQQIVWPSNISQWSRPQGCYGGVMTPNPANYPARPSFGWCNWVPEEMHLNYSGYGLFLLQKHWASPRVGAVMWFSPGDQGASSDGHWANLVGIGPNGWGMVVEMNFSYDGGGFGKIDYRYVRVYDAGVAYLYA